MWFIYFLFVCFIFWFILFLRWGLIPIVLPLRLALKQCIYIFLKACMCLLEFICIMGLQVPEETRKHGIPWIWGYRRLQLGNKPGSSAGAGSSLNCRAIPLVPASGFFSFLVGFGIELRSPGLQMSTFTCLTISLAQLCEHDFFFNIYLF